jgi:hypothetical protein
VHITEFFAGTTSANIALYVSMSGFFLANGELRMIGKIIDKLIMTDWMISVEVSEETASM